MVSKQVSFYLWMPDFMVPANKYFFAFLTIHLLKGSEHEDDNDKVEYEPHKTFQLHYFKITSTYLVIALQVSRKIALCNLAFRSCMDRSSTRQFVLI